MKKRLTPPAIPRKREERPASSEIPGVQTVMNVYHNCVLPQSVHEMVVAVQQLNGFFVVSSSSSAPTPLS